MTIAEIKEKLSQERGFGSRFPARIIFAESLESYSLLESQLKGVCDITINVADFCRAPDTVPQFDQIKAKLSEYAGKQILLLSAGEYLRLCIKRELNVERRQFLSFWEAQQSEASRTRIIMPMFSCRDIFDRVIGLVDERQKDYMWELDTVPALESYTITVYSPKFKDSIHPDAGNLSEWLRGWPTILRRDKPCSIITIQEGNVEASFGTVNIKPISSPFQYLSASLVDGNILVEKWEKPDFWSHIVALTSAFHDRVTFAQIAIAELNINDFDFVSVAARWNTLSTFQKELVWLWYRMYPTGDYYSYACQKAASASDIPARIRDEILMVASRSALWIDQRMAAMRALKFSSFDDTYFALMDKLPLSETKLQLLTYQTHEEKTYAVKVISGLLRQGAEPDAVADMIAEDYPALAFYMKECTGCDEAVDEYMSWYRKNKLINRYPGDYPVPINFERFDARYKLMHQMSGKDCASFWIDGFGIEYAPIFLHELKLRGITPDLIKIATALLPTETDYNHQWDEDDPLTEKWIRLDSCSHHGMPDDKSYYSCIVHQLAVFADAAKKVEELLDKHDYVVITGDHGSSRFAALAFHDPSVIPVTAPNKSTIRSFGRFCELDEKSVGMIALPGTSKVTTTIGGKTFLVMNTYQHFSVSGNVAGGNADDHDVAGETHGGNTAEERLVPVIIVKRKQPLAPLTCKPKSQFVTKRNGHMETTFSFNQPILTLEVSQGNNKAACTEMEDGKWQVVMDNVTANDKDEIILSVIANGRLLPKIILKVKTTGINKNTDPFGDMGL